MDIVQRILHLVLAEQYEMTDHALEGMDDDNIDWNDLISCLSSGVRRRSWPKQQKYEIAGRSVNGRRVRVVVRLIAPHEVRIITVYEDRS